MKSEYLDFIKKFSKISITMACEKAGVDRQNVLSGKAKVDKIKKVKKILESEVAKLYVIGDEDEKNTTL
jgi:hypothetical protein